MDTTIAIAVVSNRGIKPATLLCIENLFVHSKHQFFPIVATEGYTIAENRNYCMVQAINNGCTHLLFIDDDMTFPPDVVDTLLAHNKPLVGVLSYSRKLPLSPTVALLGPSGEPVIGQEVPSEPFSCYSVGMGVALIDLNAVKAMPRPWFKFQSAADGRTVIGEDEWFCNQVREHVGEVVCDPTIEIGHIGDYEYK